MKKLIAVCGTDSHVDDEIMRIAEEVGREIARRGAILVCGGRGGIMRAACKGAKEEGGLTVGILPYGKDEANEYVDVPLPTNLGSARNFLVVNVADAVIGICGRWGTLSEIAYAMSINKPTILIRGTGGISDALASLPSKPIVVDSAKEAVEAAMNASAE